MSEIDNDQKNIVHHLVYLDAYNNEVTINVSYTEHKIIHKELRTINIHRKGTGSRKPQNPCVCICDREWIRNPQEFEAKIMNDLKKWKKNARNQNPTRP